MKSTTYFQYTRQRVDRVMILDEWIKHVIKNPLREEIQVDGQIRRWARIAEMENRALRSFCLKTAKLFTTLF